MGVTITLIWQHIENFFLLFWNFNPKFLTHLQPLFVKYELQKKNSNFWLATGLHIKCPNSWKSGGWNWNYFSKNYSFSNPVYFCKKKFKLLFGSQTNIPRKIQCHLYNGFSDIFGWKSDSGTCYYYIFWQKNSLKHQLYTIISLISLFSYNHSPSLNTISPSSSSKIIIFDLGMKIL